jgi:hypothetical protein
MTNMTGSKLSIFSHPGKITGYWITTRSEISNYITIDGLRTCLSPKTLSRTRPLDLIRCGDWNHVRGVMISVPPSFLGNVPVTFVRTV